MLRPYQSQLKADIIQAWQTHRNVLAVLPTGGGKTKTFADIIAEHNAPACAIAHRQELVSQISIALNREGVRHRIIGPDKVIKSCVRLHMEDAGKSHYDPMARTAVAGVDTLIRRGKELDQWLKSVTLWVQDECFPAGTLIDGRPIEAIKVGDTVTAFNEDTGGFEQRAVTRLFKNPCPDVLIEVSIKGHHAIICTSGHPFWTNRGWVSAINLTDEDEVFIDDLQMQLLREGHPDNNGEPEIQVSEKRYDILSKILRIFSERRVSTSSERKKPAKTESCPPKRSVLHLRERNGSDGLDAKTMGRHGAGLLWKRMLLRIQKEGIFRNNGKNKPKIRVGANEEKQSHVEARNQRESKRCAHKNRASTYSARWKWEAANQCRNETFISFRGLWLLLTGNSKNGGVQNNPPRPGELQNRLRERTFKNCDRGRWHFPFFKKEEGTRCEKRFFPSKRRVEGISILERDDPKLSGNSSFDGFVYNIEVEDLHTYTANGVVVHNCHHVLSPDHNKWGKAAAMFPNAKGLGVTATPIRADGKGLGRHADGLMDVMVIGPSMRELIEMGYLVDYRIFAPPVNIDWSQVKISATTGDFILEQLDAEVKRSGILGDVVESYLKIAPGKRGITFATSVEVAQDLADRYNTAGVPAKMVSADTPDIERYHAVRDLAAGKLLQLVNVDLFGEGVDVPAVEVVSFARPTASYSLYVQQFGRALRLCDGKDYAIIIDHVGNVLRHGLPDAPRAWTLDRREKKATKQKDVIPLRSCPSCTMVYERIYRECPYCGFYAEPVGRKAPEEVDGDLHELSPDVLAQMRGAIQAVDMSIEDKREELRRKHVPHIGILAGVKRHRELQEAQMALRDAMANWGGWQVQHGRGDSEAQRRFFHKFGVDVLTAQALGAKEAEELRNKITIDILYNNAL